MEAEERQPLQAPQQRSSPTPSSPTAMGRRRRSHTAPPALVILPLSAGSVEHEQERNTALAAQEEGTLSTDAAVAHTSVRNYSTSVASSGMPDVPEVECALQEAEEVAELQVTTGLHSAGSFFAGGRGVVLHCPEQPTPPGPGPARPAAGEFLAPTTSPSLRPHAASISRRSTVNQGLSLASVTAFDEQRSQALRRFRQAVYRHIQAQRSTFAFGAPSNVANLRRKVRHSMVTRDLGKRDALHRDTQLQRMELVLCAAKLVMEVIALWWVPFRMVFHPDGDSGWKALELGIDVLQLLCFAVHFAMPYSEKGIWVSRIRFIAARYVRSPLFVYEALGALPVGFCTWFALGGRPWLLAFKLLSLPNMPTLWRRLLHGSGLFISPQMQNIFFLGVGWLLLLHLVTCGWFLVLKYGPSDASSVSPLHHTEDPLDTVLEGAPILLYCIGVDWSAKHLCGYGVTGVFPQTDEQFIFMFLVAMLGLGMYTTMLSVISLHVHTEMTQNAKARLRLKLDGLADALSELPRSFREEVRRYYISVFKVVGTIGLSDVMDDLPQELLDRVRYHVGRGLLMNVPMFSSIHEPELIDRLTGALVPKVFLPDMEIVSVGDIGHEMFFVHSGECAVATAKGRQVAILRSGDHYGELALLKLVRRCTSVTTLSAVALSVLTREAFEAVLLDYPRLGDLVRNQSPGTGLSSGQQLDTLSDNSSHGGIDREQTVITVGSGDSNPLTGSHRRSRVSIFAAVEPFRPGETIVARRLGDEAVPLSVETRESFMAQSWSAHLHDGPATGIGSFLFGHETSSPRRVDSRSTDGTPASGSSRPPSVLASPRSPPQGRESTARAQRGSNKSRGTAKSVRSSCSTRLSNFSDASALQGLGSSLSVHHGDGNRLSVHSAGRRQLSQNSISPATQSPVRQPPPSPLLSAGDDSGRNRSIRMFSGLLRGDRQQPPAEGAKTDSDSSITSDPNPQTVDPVEPLPPSGMMQGSGSAAGSPDGRALPRSSSSPVSGFAQRGRRGEDRRPDLNPLQLPQQPLRKKSGMMGSPKGSPKLQPLGRFAPAPEVVDLMACSDNHASPPILGTPTSEQAG
eukprot:TRINITY_DN55371_c0_g1_i1.p1 TRINITY_DN55371_c0_g1~~TRINITY_DN55371_c0_g1_i1.p1  ORF type:complete len:1081 (+),score=186.16 TRINITY_DN55371_c0_g1_i1:91-3333(+)